MLFAGWLERNLVAVVRSLEVSKQLLGFAVCHHHWQLKAWRTRQQQQESNELTDQQIVLSRPIRQRLNLLSFSPSVLLHLSILLPSPSGGAAAAGKHAADVAAAAAPVLLWSISATMKHSQATKNNRWSMESMQSTTDTFQCYLASDAEGANVAVCAENIFFYFNTNLNNFHGMCRLKINK